MKFVHYAGILHGVCRRKTYTLLCFSAGFVFLSCTKVRSICVRHTRAPWKIGLQILSWFSLQTVRLLPQPAEIARAELFEIGGEMFVMCPYHKDTAVSVLPLCRVELCCTGFIWGRNIVSCHRVLSLEATNSSRITSNTFSCTPWAKVLRTCS